MSIGLNANLLDFFYKKRKFLLPIAIFLTLFAVSFEFTGWSTKLVWQNYPLIAAVIGLVSILIILIWVRTEQQRVSSLIHDIQSASSEKLPNLDDKIDQLTERQKEVFELIIAGKSNKEITSTLFIELSTLKTHINQIYKKLNVKSRKEVKRYGSTSQKEEKPAVKDASTLG